MQQKGLIDMTDRMFRTELMPAEAPSRRRTPWLVGITVTILILIVLGFVAVRLSVDVPSIAAGTVPDDAYDARFVRHPWLTYLHIGPGVLYMVGATVQLAFWFRTRHYAVHRRLGRGRRSGSRSPCTPWPRNFGCAPAATGNDHWNPECNGASRRPVMR